MTFDSLLPGFQMSSVREEVAFGCDATVGSKRMFARVWFLIVYSLEQVKQEKHGNPNTNEKHVIVGVRKQHLFMMQQPDLKISPRFEDVVPLTLTLALEPDHDPNPKAQPLPKP